MILVMVIILIILVISGLPLFAGILTAAMLGLHVSGVEFTAIPIEIFRLANAPVLLAIPLFTFAGYLLSQGGTSTRLVRFSRSLFGWLPGGLGVVALVSCAFFTAITGATGITIIALGGLLFPALISTKLDHFLGDPGEQQGVVLGGEWINSHFYPRKVFSMEQL